MADNIFLPSYGGLTRYREEYDSKIQLSPGLVVGFIVFLVVFYLILNFLK
ncbi:MAG: hypothetical protein QXX68_00460 [Candidatus Pacearchaeota archaeon]